jgi:hypothetical protein
MLYATIKTVLVYFQHKTHTQNRHPAEFVERTSLFFCRAAYWF